MCRLFQQPASAHFDAVEINYSFYRLPSCENFEAWQERAPHDFLFAAKGNRFITHLRRLTDPAAPVARFFASATGLGRTTGPILWQLPPHFHRDLERLTAFLATLPPDYHHAFEFRHESWFVDAVYAALAAHNAALCLADHGDRRTRLVRPAPWIYVRFHAGLAAGGGYRDVTVQPPCGAEIKDGGGLPRSAASMTPRLYRVGVRLASPRLRPQAGGLNAYGESRTADAAATER